MPDNKRVSTRSPNNQQLVVGGNKQQSIPHCSMLIFESTPSPLRSKKRENPFDGSCDISNMLHNDKGHSLNNSKLLESKRKKKKLSEISPSIIPPINHHSGVNLSSEPSLSTSSPCTSPINLSISPSFKTTATTILPSPQPPNQSTNQRPKTMLTSITTMGNLDSFPIDASNSPHLLCNSKSGETIDMASQLDSTCRLSNSFLEDISSSILYLVTGKRDHERISEELNVIWKQETHSNNCLNAGNTLSSNNYNYCQKVLPSLDTLCILQQEKNIRNSYGNNEPSYLLPNIESLDKWHQNAFKKTKVDVAIHSSKFGSEDESHEQNSIRTLPSIASLLERQ